MNLFDKYSEMNFHLFAMHGIEADGSCTCGKKHVRDKDIGKHPAVSHGYMNAVPAKQYKQNNYYNVAVALGKTSGCFVIDVDDVEGFNSLHELENKYGKLPSTFTVKTGNGHHYYFQYPDFHVSSNQHVLGKNIEIKSNGASAHLPPSKHITGRHYEIIDDAPIGTCPEWVFRIIREYYANKENERKERQKQYELNHADDEAWSVSEVERMLEKIDPNLGYHAWVGIGMALHDGGYSITLWDKWSSTAQNYQRGCCLPHWKSFARHSGVSMGTLVEKAYLSGWRPVQEERPQTDTSKIQGFLKSAGVKKSEPLHVVNIPASVATVPPLPSEAEFEEIPLDTQIEQTKKLVTQKPLKLTNKNDGTLGFDPLKLPGLIGDTVRWIERSALFPQPELALLATLCFAGAVFGRRYASPLNTRTNIYMVGISGTGTGKDHARKSIGMLATHAELNQFLGSHSIRSESGLARELEGNASQVMMIDEFGLFLQAVGDARAAPHAKQISDLLMKLYSSSSGGQYSHGTYADARMKPIQIFDPNLCIYGTTTEESYAASLQKAAIASGNINRYIVVRPKVINPYPNLNREIQMRDEDLIKRWAEFKSSSLGEMVNSSGIRPKVKRMVWGVCEKIADRLLDEQCRMRDNQKFGSLWVRLYENTIKIAMILAISRNRIDPVFYPEDFEIAEKIVRNATNYMATLADDHMFDSETERNNLEILRFIKETGTVSKSQLLRKMRKLKRRDIDDVLMHMVESGVLEVERDSTGAGRALVMYKLIGEADGI